MRLILYTRRRLSSYHVPLPNNDQFDPKLIMYAVAQLRICSVVYALYLSDACG